MHLGGGGLGSDLRNDLLAIPFDGLAMIEFWMNVPLTC